jgi:nitrogen fixation protein FixH
MMMGGNMRADARIPLGAALPSGRPRGWWYPWLFVAAFAVVIAVNGVMVKLAIDSFSGLDTEHPYERGLGYNDTLAAARAQDALGWQVAYDAVPAGDATPDGHPISVEARFLDRDGNALTGLAVRALLQRPAVEGHDVELPLAERGGGRYVARTDLPLPGQWDFRIVATVAPRADGSDGASWQASRRILLP